jgi:hypothetical protein
MSQQEIIDKITHRKNMLHPSELWPATSLNCIVNNIYVVCTNLKMPHLYRYELSCNTSGSLKSKKLSNSQDRCYTIHSMYIKQGMYPALLRDKKNVDRAVNRYNYITQQVVVDEVDRSNTSYSVSSKELSPYHKLYFCPVTVDNTVIKLRR